LEILAAAVVVELLVPLLAESLVPAALPLLRSLVSRHQLRRIQLGVCLEEEPPLEQLPYLEMQVHHSQPLALVRMEDLSLGQERRPQASSERIPVQVVLQQEDSLAKPLQLQALLAQVEVCLAQLVVVVVVVEEVLALADQRRMRHRHRAIKTSQPLLKLVVFSQARAHQEAILLDLQHQVLLLQ
jgi:hypothetical protein